VAQASERLFGSCEYLAALFVVTRVELFAPGDLAVVPGVSAAYFDDALGVTTVGADDA
jgi:hypothetical protein